MLRTALCALLGAGLGQAPVPAPERPAERPELTVRISTEIVQLDAVVTDGSGRPVRGLRPEDFVVREDGRPQALTHAVFVDVGAAGTEPEPTGGALARAEGEGQPAASPAPLAGRRVVIVVDDYNHSFVSTVYVREALRTFVRGSLREGDQAAIVLASAGPEAEVAFTADRDALLARTSEVIWGRGWLGAYHSPLDASTRVAAPTFRSDVIPGQPWTFWGGRPPQGSFEMDVLRRDGQGRLEYERRVAAFTRGTLGVVNGVIDTLRETPGRKAVVLFSDGIPLVSPRDEQANVNDALRRLVDQANRASVVLYTLDARGLISGGVTAEDTLRRGETASSMADLGSARRVSVMESQEPLRYLAQETGGLFLASNDLGDDLNRVAADQSGYYLLGYVPSAGTFQPFEGEPRYRKVKIEVKRRGLKVRSRRGFFGVSEGDPGAPAPPPGGSLSGGASVAGVSP